MTGGADKKLLGNWGERKTAEYLKGKGYTIVDAGWHCRMGEIDLIAQDEQYLCFVEVKLRKNAAFAQAREFVDARKQEKLRASAGLYLVSHPTELQPRFDVAEVYAPQGIATAEPQVIYLENAFDG